MKEMVTWQRNSLRFAVALGVSALAVEVGIAHSAPSPAAVRSLTEDCTLVRYHSHVPDMIPTGRIATQYRVSSSQARAATPLEAVCDPGFTSQELKHNAAFGTVNDSDTQGFAGCVVLSAPAGLAKSTYPLDTDVFVACLYPFDAV